MTKQALIAVLQSYPMECEVSMMVKSGKNDRYYEIHAVTVGLHGLVLSKDMPVVAEQTLFDDGYAEQA